MLKELNEQLQAVRGRRREQERLGREREGAQREQEELAERLRALDAELQKEEQDVKRLQGLSMTALFYSMLGSKEQQAQKERQEALAARLKRDACDESLEQVTQTLATIDQQLAALGDVTGELAAVMRKKEEALSQTGSPAAKRLLGFSEALADTRADLKELKEAIHTGKAAEAALTQVIEPLQSAQNWGTWDLLGGGWVSSSIKHGRIDDARAHVGRAQSLLNRFKRELQDVEIDDRPQMDVDVGDFDRFVDAFFDNIITDWIVQSKISNSLESARRARRQVGAILETLQDQQEPLERTMSELEQERRSLIESA